MRGGEVVALDDEDFDAGRGLLLVRHAKLGKHRLLPLHPTTVTAVQDYRQLRDQRFPRPASPALLVSSAGTRLLYYNVGVTFARLARRAGLAGRSGGMPSPAARSETFLRGRHLAGLVPRRRRRRRPDAAAVGLPRPCRSRRHLLVPARRPGTARRSRPPAQRRTGRTPVTAIAATMQAFFTDYPDAVVIPMNHAGLPPGAWNRRHRTGSVTRRRPASCKPALVWARLVSCFVMSRR